MFNDYGSDYLTVSDDNGNEFELEILTSLEYNGFTYLAVIPADADSSDLTNMQISILKSIEENGEQILCAIDDDTELESVNNLIMDTLYAE